MPPAAPDFRLYQSNALDVLAGLLADALAAPVPGRSLLVPDTILIPQPAMRRWLQATLAGRCGIAANLEFLAPGEYVTRILNANLADGADDFSVETLHWRLYAALMDARFLHQTALRRIAAHVCGNQQTPDVNKTWALAGELALVFEKYQAWRRDWLLDWERGGHPEDPQAILWRNIAAGKQHRARRIHSYLERFEPADSPLPKELPARLFAFATVSISPDVLRVMATQARAGTLHFYLFSPSREYWGDLNPRFGHHLDDDTGTDENRLLHSLGAAGREFMQLMGSYEHIHPRGDISAWVDPADTPQPGFDHGGLADSLLHRVQADIFHRRAPPPDSRLPGLRMNDPSLQIHACHTRLREVQVLHDQLRALLEDARFAPPLQPREIAVLAPDISPYAPYLHAVFATPGDTGYLPWTLADTGAFRDEPLAQLFLNLLHLPLSRFGLNEILDILDTPSAYRWTGLDEQDMERLRIWLHAAGARWGLNAAHRSEHGAPFDDACTWQFALERMVLGTASGDAADVCGANGHRVAAWPELEGSATAQLGSLMQVINQLDRWRNALNAPATAEGWHARLAGVLETLFPDEPGTPSERRTLERLRAAIAGFAASAQQAGHADEIPADIVRNYFTDVIHAVDTRAPLLTGGISFARMVPMRLLPFRVICILGLNDGEFPHRDPAAGLNRITADLSSPRRRPGDRSTREDDRFLFLQLLVSAQDVFYLSYLGFDPRDGSVREPSIVVSELIDAAAQQHGNPDAARNRLTVPHPLQPFAATAFGGTDEPRRFSYQSRWYRATHLRDHSRTPVPAWIAAPVCAPDTADDARHLALDELRRFLLDPAGQFLRQRLHLKLPEVGEADSDLEPLDEGTPLQAAQLRQWVLSTLISNHADDLYERLRARALIPSGDDGRRRCLQLQRDIAPFVDGYMQLCAGNAPRCRHCMVEIDGTRVSADIGNIHPQGIVRVDPKPLNGRTVIRSGLDWLLANAAGENLALVLLHADSRSRQPVPLKLEPVASECAKTALQYLLQLRASGLCAPLAFAPYTGWKIHSCADETKARTAAHAAWHGSGNGGFAEGATDSISLAWRGRDVFADVGTYAEFARTSRAVYSVLLTAQVPQADCA